MYTIYMCVANDERDGSSHGIHSATTAFVNKQTFVHIVFGVYLFIRFEFDWQQVAICIPAVHCVLCMYSVLYVRI